MGTRRVVGVIAMLLSVAACKKRDSILPAMEVHDAWVRSAPEPGGNTAAYFRLSNGYDTTVVLSKVSSDEAERVELHETVTDAQHMTSMRRADSVVLDPFENLVLKPGGMHVMLIGTKRPLPAGETVRITMHLSNGSIFALNALVRDP